MSGNYKITLDQRFSSAFGFVAKNVAPRVLDIGLSNEGLYLPIAIQKMERNQIRGYGETGAPVFDILEVESPYIPDQIYQFNMPIMIDASRRKRTESTIVNENQEGGLDPGEVVESFGWSPWSIRIRGIMVDMENHQFPFDQIEELKAIMDIHDILKASSDLLNALDITSIYVTDDIRLASDPQYPDSVNFTITCKSHESINARILNE